MKLNMLKRRRDFDRVYRYGRKVWNEAFVLYVLPTPPEDRDDAMPWRVGITVTKKIGNAVRRNRIKRLIRESLRLSADAIRGGLDIIVVARPPAGDLRCPEAQRLLLGLLARARALKRSERHRSRPRRKPPRPVSEEGEPIPCAVVNERNVP